MTPPSKSFDSNKPYRLAVLPGDGIGPEVVAEGVGTLRAVEQHLDGVHFELTEFSVGAGEYLKSGDPLTPSTFEAIQEYDAILLGAMGLPSVRWPNGTEIAPQLDLREKLELYAGVRPIHLFNANDTPLKGYGAGSIDFVIFRENTEGLFWVRKFASSTGCESRAGLRAPVSRRGLVTLVDKANVLPSMAFFRRIFEEVAEEFPAVRAEKVYIDAMSLYLVQRPQAFDVIVTENMFGDILSDLAAGLVGGMGMAPSGDIGDRRAVFQPSHAGHAGHWPLDTGHWPRVH